MGKGYPGTCWKCRVVGHKAAECGFGAFRCFLAFSQLSLAPPGFPRVVPRPPPVLGAVTVPAPVGRRTGQVGLGPQVQAVPSVEATSAGSRKRSPTCEFRLTVGYRGSVTARVSLGGRCSACPSDAGEA